MTPAQSYDAMTDAEIVEFVRHRRPGLLWRAQNKPRCEMLRKWVIEELSKQPLFEPLEESTRHA